MEKNVMIKIVHYKSETNGLLEASVKLFQKIRNEQYTKLSEDEIMGLNYNIVLNTACILEGKLESILSNIIHYYTKIYTKVDITDFYLRKTINSFFDNTISDLKSRVARTIGIRNYISLLGQLIPDYVISDEMKRLSEGVNVLFEFRNVLAHGRMISAETETSIPYPNYIEMETIEYFKGGYKNTEDYLIKNKLNTSKFIDSESVGTFFTNQVADHFLELSNKYLVALEKSLPEDFKHCAEQVSN